MLIDDVTITVKGGKGGDGASTFLHVSGNYKGGPNGGNGGNGGSVYIQGSDDLTALQQFQFKKTLTAEDGVNGQRKNLYGRNGKNIVLFVPRGTHVYDLVKKKEYELSDNEAKILIAKGGHGGRGNTEFKSATNQAPHYAEKGVLGEEKQIRLELRLIADIGLIGLPNAGKSSLLAALTNAHPKIADYPFTTLEPNLGVLFIDGQRIILADIPGLIEGASKGKGLGIQFLKHIEKTKALIHCIDATGEKLVTAYKTIRSEFEQYGHDLMKKKELIFLTKADLLTDKEIKDRKKELATVTRNIYFISVYNDSMLAKARKILKQAAVA